MNVPGSARTHVWVGMIVALAGALVGGYAYTGDRIYDIVYLPVALLGLALLIGGSALVGHGQANRPRLGGRQANDDEPGFLDKVKNKIAGLTGDDEDGESGDADDEESLDDEERDEGDTDGGATDDAVEDEDDSDSEEASTEEGEEGDGGGLEDGASEEDTGEESSFDGDDEEETADDEREKA